jgi:hypothetical protein
MIDCIDNECSSNPRHRRWSMGAKTSRERGESDNVGNDEGVVVLLTPEWRREENEEVQT